MFLYGRPSDGSPLTGINGDLLEPRNLRFTLCAPFDHQVDRSRAVPVLASSNKQVSQLLVVDLQERRLYAVAPRSVLMVGGTRNVTKRDQRRR